MSNEKKVTKVSVHSIYDHGKDYDHKAHKDEMICLWGVDFKCDGKGFKANLIAEDASAMIELGRVKKV